MASYSVQLLKAEGGRDVSHTVHNQGVSTGGGARVGAPDHVLYICRLHAHCLFKQIFTSH